MTRTIAVAGIGAAAETHARAIGDIDGATLVAGSCRTASKGEAFAEAFDCTWYADTANMLDREAVDVLSVCTPSGAHLGPTLTAAERGVDVLCEKPLEITTDRVDEMIEACAAAGVRLGGVFQQRFDPVLQTVHEAAAAGRFGGLATANASVPWWRDDEYYADAWQGTRDLDGGGALMNQAIHGVDAIQWLAGAAGGGDAAEHADAAAADGGNPVAEVFAYADTLAHEGDAIEVEDTAVAVLRYRNGALGQILAATSAYPGSLKRLQLAGRGGTATVREDGLATWQFREERDADADVRERFTGSDAGGAADPTAIDHANHARNIRAFLDARAADEPFLLDPGEARKAVAVVEAIYESAETGSPVAVA
ncbi:MAG: Gfo/Idh/MocA family protein [Halobacteriaceae archaeon]